MLAEGAGCSRAVPEHAVTLNAALRGFDAAVPDGRGRVCSATGAVVALRWRIAAACWRSHADQRGCSRAVSRAEVASLTGMLSPAGWVVEPPQVGLLQVPPAHPPGRRVLVAGLSLRRSCEPSLGVCGLSDEACGQCDRFSSTNIMSQAHPSSTSLPSLCMAATPAGSELVTLLHVASPGYALQVPRRPVYVRGFRRGGLPVPHVGFVADLTGLMVRRMALPNVRTRHNRWP